MQLTLTMNLSLQWGAIEIEWTRKFTWNGILHCYSATVCAAKDLFSVLEAGLKGLGMTEISVEKCAKLVKMKSVRSGLE